MGLEGSGTRLPPPQGKGRPGQLSWCTSCAGSSAGREAALSLRRVPERRGLFVGVSPEWRVLCVMRAPP